MFNKMIIFILVASCLSWALLLSSKVNRSAGAIVELNSSVIELNTQYALYDTMLEGLEIKQDRHIASLEDLLGQEYECDE